MKFAQLMEYNMKNVCPQKWYKKLGKETSARRLFGS